MGHFMAILWPILISILTMSVQVIINPTSPHISRVDDHGLSFKIPNRGWESPQTQSHMNLVQVQNPKSFSESWSLFSMENDGNPPCCWSAWWLSQWSFDFLSVTIVFFRIENNHFGRKKKNVDQDPWPWLAEIPSFLAKIPMYFSRFFLKILFIHEIILERSKLSTFVLKLPNCQWLASWLDHRWFPHGFLPEIP